VGSLAIGIASAFGCRRPARFYAITMIDDDDVNIMRSHEGILPQSGSHQEATEAVPSYYTRKENRATCRAIASRQRLFIS